MLQTALELEHSTIPIYMNGFLSIKPWQNEEVKKMLHHIIVDEMFHFAQVANIINGLGGRPYLLGNTFVPAFPSHLPGGCRPNMIASINKISTQQVLDVYMEIEEPSYVLKDHELGALINKISTGKNICRSKYVMINLSFRYLKHEQECFISAFISDKARTANILNGLKTTYI